CLSQRSNTAACWPRDKASSENGVASVGSEQHHRASCACSALCESSVYEHHSAAAFRGGGERHRSVHLIKARFGRFLHCTTN
ncbi:unnamed protein product, partial [Gadus morhua 'NCC']